MKYLAWMATAIPLLIASQAWAAAPNGKKLEMEWSPAYEGPMKESSIYKVTDREEGVICYVMLPDSVSYKITPTRAYEGNSVGAISCVKLSPSAPANSPAQKK